MNWIRAIVCWLNDNSAAVMAVGTVVIAWASWVSSRLVRLQKRMERANRMPILTFAEERRADYRELYVKNVGYGPALNIVRKIIEPGDFLQRSPVDEPLILGSLAPGDRVYAFKATLPPNASVSVLDDPKFHAVIECDDILKQSYEVVYQHRTHSTRPPIAKRKMPASQAQRV